MKKVLLCRYDYDPLDRLTGLLPHPQAPRQRFYRQNRLATDIQGDVQHSIVRHGDQLLALQRHDATSSASTLLATDPQHSVLYTVSATEQQAMAYSPYGHHPTVGANQQLLGFNGECADPVTGHYLLGNGYRAFNPVLMRFNSPDSWSPFGKGGINCYRYCLNNPVNYRDPSGHAVAFWNSFFAMEGITTSMGGMALAFSSSARTSPRAMGAYISGSLGVLYGGVALRMPGTTMGEVMAGASSALGAVSMTMGTRASRQGFRALSRQGSLDSMEEALDQSARFRPNRRNDAPPPYRPPLPGFQSTPGPSLRSSLPDFESLPLEIQRGPRGRVPEYTPISQAHSLTTPQRVRAQIRYLPEVHSSTDAAQTGARIRETQL